MVLSFSEIHGYFASYECFGSEVINLKTYFDKQRNTQIKYIIFYIQNHECIFNKIQFHNIFRYSLEFPIIIFIPSLPFMDIDCTDEQIKLMFKVAKRLQYTFSDVKRLTTKYLLKAKKIKAKKAELCMEREDRKKREEREAKMRDKIEEKKVRKEQERAQREIEQQKEDKKKEEEQKAQPKSIFSMIKPDKSKNPTTSKSKGKQKQTGTIQGQGQQKFLQKPTQPESPYFQFLKTKRKEIRATTPNMSMAQISQIMRKIWESMTDDEKRPFVQEYELQKAKYQRDMIIYYKQPNLEVAEANRKQQEGEKDGLGDYAFLEELCQKRPDA